MARGGASTLILLAALGGGGIWAYTKYGASLGLTGPADPTKPPGTPGGPAGPPRAPGGSGGASGGSGGASGGSGGASGGSGGASGGSGGASDPTINRPTGSEVTSAWVDLGVGGVAPGLAWSSLDGLVYNIDGAVTIGGPFPTVWEAQSFGRTWLGLGDWSPGIE